MRGDLIWKGVRFLVEKEPGQAVSGGRGEPQTWVPVAYVIRDMDRGGSNGKPVKRIHGRQSKAAVAVLVEEAKARDAQWLSECANERAGF